MFGRITFYAGMASIASYAFLRQPNSPDFIVYIFAGSLAITVAGGIALLSDTFSGKGK